MKSDDKDLTDIDFLELRAKRKISEVQRLLLPDLRDMVAAEQMAQRVGERLAELPDDQRRLFSLQTALALSDLNELEDSLTQYMDLVSDELKRRNGAQQAMTAYQQPIRNLSRKRGRQN
jgi:Asp-tRNA(Asn)/Glu-tRNA(Gln) amidotransferase B subunit